MVLKSACKIRKRGCSSSSSTSSILTNQRLKRAILVGRRGGSSTPMPTWKMSSRSRSPVAFVESPLPQNVAQKAKQGPVSARKLAATLWEMNEIPRVERLREVNLQKKMQKGRSSLCSHDRRSAVSGSLPRHLSDPPHTPVSETTDRSGTGSLRRRFTAISQKYKCQGFDSLSRTSLMEIEARSRDLMSSESLVALRNHIKDNGHCSSTYRELLKILNRIWGLEEQHSTSMSIVSALREELKKARVQIDRLVEEHRSDRREIEYMMKRVAEEKAAWKSRERERIQDVVQTAAAELEVERKLRRRMESMNKKLADELTETKALLAKAYKELGSERKVKQVMEELCDELARGIREDKAEAEELKKESAKAWEEVEREREMLQLADVWREERVQMKLADARFQLEEKNAVLDKLKKELEVFLKTKSPATNHKNSTACVSTDKEQQDENIIPEKSDHDQNVDDNDSVDSDLHSIELNRDESSRGYKWSYASGAAREEDGSNFRSQDLERLKATSLSFETGVIEGIEWDLSRNQKQESGISDQGRCSDIMDTALSANQVHKHDYDLEMQRYKYVKGLRDQVMAGSRVATGGLM
ncbi:Uncharacterized protein EJ110_NYTH16450 [Nymphaea thermarum]|nr:Uncharacterized protein EJ110_NYTH16450 [Nymphaea thermarum]